MAYVAPFIDAAGLHIPSYSDINAYELQQFLSIYGASVVTGEDSADVEWISIFSLMVSDVMNAIQLAYNARSPLTAVGADLDSIVKINGIARLQATFSTAVLSVGGNPGAPIAAGIAQDTNGFLWTLPQNINIPAGGTAFVLAICESPGAIAAPPGTINIVSNPTAGWNSVTNAAAATEGEPTESDSQLRARQSISVALSSKTLLVGTISAIAELPGVTRYGTIGVENPTGGTDIYGNPPHSISMVVEGGTDLAIATAIYNNKSIGCFTNGTTSVNVTDPTTDNVAVISFFRPTYNTTYVTLVIHGLTGFTSATQAAILQAVFTYLNSLQIGEELTISGLYGAALAVMPSLLTPQFSIQAVYASLTPVGIGTFAIDVAGTGYTAGDVVTLVQGGASGGQLKVISVAAGVPTALAFVAPGDGYTVATGLATTGGTGSGLTVSLTAVGPNTSTDIPTDFNAVVLGALPNVVVQLV